MSFRSSFLLVLLTLASAASAQNNGPFVRVHVLGSAGLSRATLEAVDGPVSIFVDQENAPLAVLGAGESATVERSGRTVRVVTPRRTHQAEKVEVVTTPGALISLQSGTHRRRYAGSLLVDHAPKRPTVLRLINHVPLEPYVASVVASEYPFSEPEGVKAQAILARTYVLRSAGKYGSYDVFDDTRSQVYKGHDAATNLTRAAVNATRGEVLLYSGALAEATYSSSSGGHTASNEDVWDGRPVPYLRGRPDPYDKAAPDHRWTTTAEVAGVHRALSRRFGGAVTGAEVIERASSGRVKRVRLKGSGKTISGSDFRVAVNAAFGIRTIRSTNFSLERSGNRYRFNGRGFGHGVGMSQYGAQGQARDGRTYRDILDFYFAGTSVASHPTALASSAGVTPRQSVATLSDLLAAGHASPETNQVRRRPTPRHLAPRRSEAPTWTGAAESSVPKRRTAW